MSRLTSFLTPGKSQDDEKGIETCFKNCIIGAREKFFNKPYQSSLSSSSNNSFKDNVPIKKGTNTINQKTFNNLLSINTENTTNNNGEKTSFRRAFSDRLKKVPSTSGIIDEASNSFTARGEIQHSPLRQSVSLNTTVNIACHYLNIDDHTLKSINQGITISNFQDASECHLELGSNMNLEENISSTQPINDFESFDASTSKHTTQKDDLSNSNSPTFNFSTISFAQNSVESLADGEELVCFICQVEKIDGLFPHSVIGLNQTLNIPWTVKDICRFLLRPQSKVRCYLLHRFCTTTTLAPKSYSLKFPRFPKSISLSRKSPSDLSDLLDVPFFHQLSHLLSHVWLKLAQLIQRLSSRFHKCTKLELISAIKIMIPTVYLKEICISNCAKAVTSYAVSSDNFKISKSERAGLYFDVGKFQRWMVEFNIATFVKEYAPVYAAALMETLCEEMCIMLLMGYNSVSSILMLNPEFDLFRDDVDIMAMFFKSCDGSSTSLNKNQDIFTPLINRFMSNTDTLCLQDVLILADTFILVNLLLGHPQVPLNVASILQSAMDCYNRHLLRKEEMGHLTPNGKVIHMAVAKFKHNTPTNLQSEIFNDFINGPEMVDLKEKANTNMTSITNINEICNTFCSLDFETTSNNIHMISQFLWTNPNYQINLRLSSFNRKSRLHDSTHFEDNYQGYPWDTSSRNYHSIADKASVPFNSHSLPTRHGYNDLSISRCLHNGPLSWTREASRVLFHYFRCPQTSALNLVSLSSGSQNNNDSSKCNCKGWLTSLTDQFIAKDSDNKGKRFERKHSCDFIGIDSLNHLNAGRHHNNFSNLRTPNVLVYRPSLYNWIMTITGFAEHRDGNCILPEDVFQAVSLLLPNNNYPPPSILSIHEELKAHAFYPINSHHHQGENGNNEHTLAICRKLSAFQMLSTNNVDLVPMAINLFNLKNEDLLGRSKSINQQDLTNIAELSISPLMYSTIEGNISIIKTLLSLGVDIDQDVSITEVNCCPFLPRYYSEIYHWTALSFAVMFTHYNVVELLLENGANVEGGIKFGEELCFSETPLQLASAAGYLGMVSLILAKGGDPYLCTAYNHRSSCCLPPSPSPLLGIVEGGGGNASMITTTSPPYNLQNTSSLNSYNSYFSVLSTSSNLHQRQEHLLSPPHFRSGASSNHGICEITTSYSNFPHRHRINSATCCGIRAGSHAPFILAASHGRLDVLKKLLAQPLVPKPRDILSLEEILAEGCSMFLAGANQGSTNSHSLIPPNFYDKNLSNDNGSVKDVNATMIFSKLNVLPSIFTFPTFSNNNGNGFNSTLYSNEGTSKKETSEIDLEFNQAGSNSSNDKSVNKGDSANLDIIPPNNNVSVDLKANRKVYSMPESNSLIPIPVSLGNLTAMYMKDKSRRHSQPKMFWKRSTVYTDADANDYLTLEEILAEGYMPPGPSSPSIYSSSSNKSPNLNNKGFLKKSNCIMGLNSKNVNISNLTKAQARVLMEALYHAAESGHVEICMELRNLGIPWNLHIWIKCLLNVYDDPCLSEKFLIRILSDFTNIKLEEVNIPELMEIALPILLDIFYESSLDYQELSLIKDDNEYNKHRVDSKSCYSDVPSTFILVSRIISTCYTSGIKSNEDIIPAITRTTQSLRSTLIDPCYVNSSELSDISFLVEGQIFYGHKIILVNSSPRFKAMLSNKFAEGTQNIIEIPEIRYAIFKVIMEFLYSGKIDSIVNQSLNFILELMAASNFFLLDGLQRECEILCSKIINNANCVSIYKTAMLYACEELANYCVGYFMKNMPVLIDNTDFIGILSTSTISNELHARIYHALMGRLRDRIINIQVNGSYGGPQYNNSYT